jgi:hypothetical protein
VGGISFMRGDGKRLSVTFLLLAVVACAVTRPAGAVLRPPTAVEARDSLSSASERGIELVRFTQYAGHRLPLAKGGLALAYLRWKTDQRSAEQEVDRVRQDGRWYAGGAQPVLPRTQLWVGAEGEHYDDRPKQRRREPTTAADLQPREVEIAAESTHDILTAASAVRILRGGGGLLVRPYDGIRATVGAGAVEDRRIGHVQHGWGLWSSLAADTIETGGYVQSAALEYNRETPHRHKNTDLIGSYSVFREFFPGNSNRAEASGSLLSRDIYFDASDRLSHRTDEHWQLRDMLEYQVQRHISAQLNGEIKHDRTTQSGGGSGDTELEDNETGFGARLDGTTRGYSGYSGIDIRQATQTIRGDVLQGLKTDLLLGGAAPMPLASRLQLRLLVSKYRLDTRSEANHDDHDELRYTGEVAWSKPAFETMVVELHAAVTLDHLVYVAAENSANNRWTRYFVTGARIQHRPTAGIANFLRATVSANYADYDFELNSRTTRSTVFRRLMLGDSSRIQLWPRISMKLSLAGQIEELGRLYWGEFQEDRSDETRSYNASVEGAWRFCTRAEFSAGALWESRRSVRFPENQDDPRTVYQDYRTYGPIAGFEYRHAQLVAGIHARALKQLRLALADRWLFTGEALIAWKF